MHVKHPYKHREPVKDATLIRSSSLNWLTFKMIRSQIGVVKRKDENTIDLRMVKNVMYQDKATKVQKCFV